MAFWHANAASEVPRRPFDLQWQAPAQCPSQTQVLQQIAAIAAPLEQSSRRANVTVARLADGSWEARLELSDRAGTAFRVLRGETCTALADATAVVLAMTITREERPLAESRLEVARRPAHPTDREARWGIGAGGMLDIGTQPAAAAGLTAAASYSPGGMRFELGVAWLYPRAGVMESRPWEGADFSLLRVGVEGCRMFEPGAVMHLGPCLGAGLEWITGSGFGSQVPMDATSLSVSLEAGTTALVRLSEVWRLRFGVDISAALRRPVFEIQGAGEVHRAQAAVVRLFLGPELYF